MGAETGNSRTMVCAGLAASACKPMRALQVRGGLTLHAYRMSPSWLIDARNFSRSRSRNSVHWAAFMKLATQY